MNLLIYVFLISFVKCFESTCKYLHVSTDIDKSKDDIIKAGVPARQWVLEADTFQLVNNSVQMDYLYVSMDNKIQLTQDMVQLEFDDHYFANSTLNIEHHQNNVFSLKIDYRCKQYGGRLIQYEVIFNIPSCGSAKIYWQKLCGSPLIKRHGLNVDALIKSYNQTVVKDGELVNKAYWDKDFDNFVFTVPANLNYSIFYVYMNLTKNSDEENILNKEETKDFFKEVDQSKSEAETTQEEFQVLEAILKLIPEVHISPPYVDADHTITKPIIRGDLFKGGVVTDEPSTLIVEYNCVENGNTTIELNIPLQYFQDITMVFQKQCVVSAQSSFSTLSFLFYLICFAVAGFMLYTFEVHKMSLSDILRTFQQRQRFNYKATGKDEDIESEFKIGRLVDNQESKYGSI
ncbi:unnamed protein product (macronuclear) [Paramecium tetraurelia]|uniref:Uncharacterized protein n=1 Tax=Paramecium tetraurelia TaxID=5888 RepID=A0CDI6_PARTE|nr:uncharacterized protein GSPATT00007064001 [Paramecium tetraurelia]CAK68853.1 unnamed protein product [Paramecium tetraurelia]|eukprot:XP_001436250.1 hypothetical protein (macronuclear) [Paramecium tetraurelia strain d4-2]